MQVMEQRLEGTYRQDAIDEEHRKARLALEAKQETASSAMNRQEQMLHLQDNLAKEKTALVSEMESKISRATERLRHEEKRQTSALQNQEAILMDKITKESEGRVSQAVEAVSCLWTSCTQVMQSDEDKGITGCG